MGVAPLFTPIALSLLFEFFVPWLAVWNRHAMGVDDVGRRDEPLSEHPFDHHRIVSAETVGGRYLCLDPASVLNAGKMIGQSTEKPFHILGVPCRVLLPDRVRKHSRQAAFRADRIGISGEASDAYHYAERSGDLPHELDPVAPGPGIGAGLFALLRRDCKSPGYSPRPGSYSLPYNGLLYSAGDPISGLRAIALREWSPRRRAISSDLVSCGSCRRLRTQCSWVRRDDSEDGSDREGGRGRPPKLLPKINASPEGVARAMFSAVKPTDPKIRIPKTHTRKPKPSQ